MESLSDRLYRDGSHDVALTAYVEVAGYGQATAPIAKDPPRRDLTP